jgi:hydrogenase nickel incorporation protein HypA/HybF
MHEMSVAQAIHRQVQRAEIEHGSRRAVACAVEVGPLSGVEPLLLQSAFADLMRDLKRNLSLTIQEVPLHVRCRDCRVESSLDGFQFICPACASPQVQIISGDQIQLLHVDLE